MEFHPHIHSIVTGCGLKNNHWVKCDKDYLFKVKFWVHYLEESFYTI